MYPNSKFVLATTGVNLNSILKLTNDLKDIKNFKLTISLHSAIQEKRARIMPIKQYIKELVANVKKFQKEANRDVEWNYVLFDNVNDTVEDAKELEKLLGRNQYIKINKFNLVERSSLTESKNIDNFITELRKCGFEVEYYEANGADINAACGQMISK